MTLSPAGCLWEPSFSLQMFELGDFGSIWPLIWLFQDHTEGFNLLPENFRQLVDRKCSQIHSANAPLFLTAPWAESWETQPWNTHYQCVEKGEESPPLIKIFFLSLPDRAVGEPICSAIELIALFQRLCSEIPQKYPLLQFSSAKATRHFPQQGSIETGVSFAVQAGTLTRMPVTRHSQIKQSHTCSCFWGIGGVHRWNIGALFLLSRKPINLVEDIYFVHWTWNHPAPLPQLVNNGGVTARQGC